MEEQVQKLEGRLDEQVKTIKEDFNVQVEELKNEVDEQLQQQNKKKITHVKEVCEQLQQNLESLARGGATKAEGISRPDVKPPQFDGKVSRGTYLRQFEAAATANGWTDSEKATGLIIALRGEAIDVLKGIPVEQYHSFEHLKDHLEMRYGDKHMQHVYQVQLKGRLQLAGENLQHLEADILRLVRLASPTAPPEFLEQLSIQHVIDGLRNGETQQALRLGRHRTLNDAVSCSGVRSSEGGLKGTCEGPKSLCHG
ncbi:hypothetical protein NQ318_005974 [Aromia moschata]|uniref:Uncharacterized protein n=1 Tax=Aromia moschata TaxID=1265417 RepID=A0AAV8XYW0_9CUCU|nr:hypothetical protein NQ318_005974 [Aromia moschata]